MFRVITFLLTLFLMLYTGCASQQAPGGGPEDKTGPLLVAQTIVDGATDLQPNENLIFHFSEVLDPLSVKKAVTLFPLNRTEIEVKVRRNRVIIKPKPAWDESLIYLLLLDRSISDLRRNNTQSPLSLAFSTGKKIPQTHLSGYVSGLKKGEEATIILSQSADSLYQKVLYRTQANEFALWSLKRVPEGVYY
ncbi:MAG TPA: hypothetical protein ENN84_07285, partial [Candidatus Marinimicrobia bacterium]|nr:hypothetical protein [Candidatus Neomarinimicrobiota bacterium]